MASHDERFRPVNVRTGPDGGIYIVDMYRDIIRHKTYVTTWLRQQIAAIASYVSTKFGRENLPALTIDNVKKIRAECEKQGAPWSAEALDKLR